MTANDFKLPTDLQWGAATASWQIEGDVAGRGRSIWDDLADRPGAIVDGATGEPACDHVNRYIEDLDLLTWLGVDAYRFSISWPRVQSPAGVDFYDRLIDGLLERNMEPVATLYHWDLPSEVEAAGGWRVRDTAERFAEYAGAMGERFADRVERWATLNEPWCSAFLGYAAGIHAPGVKEPAASLDAAYHLMLAHGLGATALRAHGARNVGVVHNLIPIIAESDDPETITATDYIDGLQNRIFLSLSTSGTVPDDVREMTAHLTDWSVIRDGDAALIGVPLDWMGENYYTVMRVAAGPGSADAVGQDHSMFPGAPQMHFVPRQPVTDMGWEVIASGLTDVLHRIARDVPNVPLWVTENGAAYPRINDADRISYYRNHVQALLDAREQGVPMRGYFLWSLLDNLEWAEGWTKKFGIIDVDPATGTRTPKDSAHWWRSALDRPRQ